MNLLLFLIITLVSIAFILVAQRHSLTALYITMAVFYVITNMTAGKIAIVDFYLFSAPASCAAPLYACIFLGTDIIAERYTRRAAIYAVWFGFASQIVLIVIGFLIKSVSATPDNFMAEPLEVIFGFAPRLVLGSLVAYIISQHIDIFIFHSLKKLHGKRLLWLRNNASTLVSQFIDSLLVFVIAFTGVIDNWIPVMLSTYVIKVVVALIDTPFLYLARSIGSKEVQIVNHE